MDASTNSLNWFEIPVVDMARAKHFYQVVFSIHMDETAMNDVHMAMFPRPNQEGNGKVHGALVQSSNHQPSMEGAVIYLNANPDMSPILEKVESEGGRIFKGKTLISPEIGYMAYFGDTEGNRLALHSLH